MPKVVSTDGCRGVHGLGFGEVQPRVELRLKKFKKEVLFKVVGACRVSWRRADSLVLFGDKGIVGELFVGGIAPEFHADSLVQALGKCFGQTVCQSLQH